MMFEAFGFMQRVIFAVQKIISATFGGAALAVLFALSDFLFSSPTSTSNLALTSTSLLR
jgi:hypothetical protein